MNKFILQTPSGSQQTFNLELLIRTSYRNIGKYSLIGIDDIKVDPPINVKGIHLTIDDILDTYLGTYPPYSEIDVDHASKLSQHELDLYALKFNVKLDGRYTKERMLIEFFDKTGIEHSIESDIETGNTASDIETGEPSLDPSDSLKCPHCGTVARTEASYKKNHGDNCFKKT